MWSHLPARREDQLYKHHLQQVFAQFEENSNTRPDSFLKTFQHLNTTVAKQFLKRNSNENHHCCKLEFCSIHSRAEKQLITVTFITTPVHYSTAYPVFQSNSPSWVCASIASNITKLPSCRSHPQPWYVLSHEGSRESFAFPWPLEQRRLDRKLVPKSPSTGHSGNSGFQKAHPMPAICVMFLVTSFCLPSIKRYIN